MSLVHELMTDLWKEEVKGDIKEIRIHPEYYYKLMAETDVTKYVETYAHHGKNKFRGIPINMDTDVEKWKLIN